MKHIIFLISFLFVSTANAFDNPISNFSIDNKDSISYLDSLVVSFNVNTEEITAEVLLSDCFFENQEIVCDYGDYIVLDSRKNYLRGYVTIVLPPTNKDGLFILSIDVIYTNEYDVVVNHRYSMIFQVPYVVPIKQTTFGSIKSMFQD